MMQQFWVLLHLLLLVGFGKNIEVQIEPKGCVCQERVEYKCHVHEAHSLVWHDTQFGNIEYDNRLRSVGDIQQFDSVTANLTSRIINDDLQSLNFTSSLRVHNSALNKTELICSGLLLTGAGVVTNEVKNTITICITGVSSGPSYVFVEWNLTSTLATVQFHPPVYGAECVIKYIVKAEKGKEKVMCNLAHTKRMQQTYTCMMPENNLMGYDFIAVAVSKGRDESDLYASTSVECNAPFPAKVSITERSNNYCGFELPYNVTWSVDGQDSTNLERVMVSWIQDDLGKVQHNYEEADTNVYHLLKLGPDVTGLVKVTVIFINRNCFKQQSTVFEGKVKKRILNVSFNSDDKEITVIIKNCQNSTFNDTLLVIFTAKSDVIKTEHFQALPNITIPFGYILEEGIPINITIKLIQGSSGEITDEFSTEYIATTVQGTKYRDHQSSSLSLLFIVPVISVIILMLSALIVILAVVMKKIIIAKGQNMERNDGANSNEPIYDVLETKSRNGSSGESNTHNHVYNVLESHSYNNLLICDVQKGVKVDEPTSDVVFEFDC